MGRVRAHFCCYRHHRLCVWPVTWQLFLPDVRVYSANGVITKQTEAEYDLMRVVFKSN